MRGCFNELETISAGIVVIIFAIKATPRVQRDSIVGANLSFRVRAKSSFSTTT
jgi:hypothetical protein